MSRREQHVGTCGFEGFQARDRVFKVGSLVEEVLRARRHDKITRRPRCGDGLANALDHMLQRVDGLILAAVASSIEAPARPALVATSISRPHSVGSSWNPFFKSAETGMPAAAQIDAHGACGMTAEAAGTCSPADQHNGGRP